MVDIPQKYPFGCTDQEIANTISALNAAIMASAANINTVLQLTPLIQLGQNELQKRLDQNSSNTLSKTLDAITQLENQTRILKDITEGSSANSDKLAKASIAVALFSLLISIAVYPIYKQYEQIETTSAAWEYVAFELEWDSITLANIQELMSNEIKILQKRKNNQVAPVLIPRILLTHGLSMITSNALGDIKGGKADELFGFYSSAELTNRQLDNYFKLFSEGLLVSSPDRFYSAIGDGARAVLEQLPINSSKLASSFDIAHKFIAQTTRKKHCYELAFLLIGIFGPLAIFIIFKRLRD